MFISKTKLYIFTLLLLFSYAQTSISDSQMPNRYNQHTHESSDNWAYRLLEQFGTEFSQSWFDNFLKNNGLSRPTNYNNHYHPPQTSSNHHNSQQNTRNQQPTYNNLGASCRTASFSCQLWQPAQVGSNCFCQTYNGNYNGQVF